MDNRRKRHLTCYECGESNPGEAFECQSCGSMRLSEAGVCRPSFAEVPKDAGLPWPMSMLYAWPAGHSVAMSGPPGSGKSTLAIILGSFFARESGRFALFTSEQTGKQVAGLIARVAPSLIGRISIYIVKGAVAFRTAIEDVVADFIVIDSLSALAGYEEQVAILHRVDDWMLDGPNRRALIVQQVNGLGNATGKVEIPHLVDAVSEIEVRDGLRVYNVTKNRAGPIGSRYFGLGAEGPVAVTFRYAYSVEGEPGRYRLHPYPLPGARWAGMLDTMSKAGSLRPGLACAAIPVQGYPGGALQPDDVSDRRDFAAAHGLAWLDPESEDTEDAP